MDKKLGSSFSGRVLDAVTALWLAVCFVLAVPILDNASFWLDEFVTIHVVELPFDQMTAYTLADVHPPLYYYIVKLVTMLPMPAGYIGLQYRIPSIIPLLILFPVLFFSVRPRMGRLACVIVGTLAALSHYGLDYCGEARMYSWAMLFVTLCGYGLYLVLATGGSRGSWALFAAGGVLTAYTHYYAFISVCFLYAFLLAALAAQKKPLRPWLLWTGVSVVLYAPWLAAFLPSLPSRTASFALDQAQPLTSTLDMFFGTRIASWALLAFSAALCTACLAAAAVQRRFSAEDWFVLAALGATALTIALGYGASALIHPLWVARYIYPCCGLVWLSLGVCAGRLLKHRDVRALGAVLALALTVYACVKPYRDRMETTRECNRQIEESVQYICDRAQPGDRVVSSVGLTMNSQMLRFYFPDLEVVPYDETGRWLDGRANVFLCATELTELDPEVAAAAQRLGMQVRQERGIRLANSYASLYEIMMP